MKRKIFFLLLLFHGIAMSAENIRPFLTTGPWYPSDPQRLNQMLDGFLKQTPIPEKTGTIRGIIAPHAGYEYSGLCAARAFRYLSPSQPIRRVFLLGASHHYGFYGACVSDFSAFATPLGQVAVDTEICRSLSRQSFFRNDKTAMQNEHSLENQLPFLQKALGNNGYKIVPILFGSLNKTDFAPIAEIIGKYINADTLIVTSSDLTHYGENFSYTPFRTDTANNLTHLDKGFIEKIVNLDFDAYFRFHEKTGITACGFVPIGVMIRLFSAKNCLVDLCDYRKSGDLNKDYTNSVSYASLLFNTNEKTANKKNAAEDHIGLELTEQETLLQIARATLQVYLENGKIPANIENRFQITEPIKKNLGVFVTLKKNNELRGCIGSIIGSEPLYKGVIANAIHAAVEDPRFSPLPKKELADCKIEISVMTPLQPLADYHAIRLGTDGVIIRDGFSQAVFLPQVASETGWSLDQFLGNLCLKAGLESDAYHRSRTMQFHVFQAQVFSEKDRRK